VSPLATAHCKDMTHLEQPQETHAGYKFLKSHIGTGEDIERSEERWTAQAEKLVRAWAWEWHARVERHEEARTWWRRAHYSLDIPNALLPLVISAVWGRLPPADGAPLATATLVLSGCMAALSALLQAEAKAERHLHAGHRYADLISDAEETLCKDRAYRTDVDVTVQGFKMRSDALLRISPPVRVGAEHDTSDEETPQ
jgi:hypothetical protein